jgi:G patch domain-containing protein 1
MNHKVVDQLLDEFLALNMYATLGTPDTVQPSMNRDTSKPTGQRGRRGKQEENFVSIGTEQPTDVSDVRARDRNNFLPVWQQEARDEKGKKRLHGAFTGGFSAGYYNTVGSKEG